MAMRVLSVLFVLAVLWSSCSKDSEDPDNPLVGTWRDDSRDCPVFYQFENGGTGRLYQNDCNNACPNLASETISSDISWSATSNVLEFIITDNEKACNINAQGVVSAFFGGDTVTVLYTMVSSDTVEVIVDIFGNTDTYVRQ